MITIHLLCLSFKLITTQGYNYAGLEWGQEVILSQKFHENNGC